jgi:hypothetical protein
VVAAVIAGALVALAIALPWLVVAPLPGVAAAAAAAIALVAAFHGAGLAVARLADQRSAPPLLVVQWGIAALIGLSGLAIAAGIGTRALLTALVLGGIAAHSIALGAGFRRRAARVAELLAARPWLVPAALIVGLGALGALGAAGDAAQPFDDDGHLAAQVERVLQTGALADPVGYPRRGGLGGQVALTALAAAAGDGLGSAIDALVLALGLAASRIGAADRRAALWAALLAAAGFALAPAQIDAVPCWTAVGLAVALYAMLGEADPPALPLALTAGALAALRHELAPIAAVAVILAWWRRRADLARTAALLGGALGVVAPLAIARLAAWRSVPPAVHALVAPATAPLALRAALAAALAAPAVVALRAALPGRALGCAAVASAVAVAALAAHVTGDGAYSARLYWPIAIAIAIALIVELARDARTGPAALIGSLLLCLVMLDASQTPGRRRWWYRVAEAATRLEYLRAPAAAPDPYAAVLAGAPPGATVAVWVGQPERLDYARHRVIDLRSPAVARLRVHRFAPHASQLEAVLSGVAASYLLIEDDDARIERIHSDLVYRFACRRPRPMCDDDLEAIAARHPVVARQGNLRLVDLRR